MLLHFGVVLDGRVGRNLDGLAAGEIAEENSGIGPFKIPAVVDSEQRIAAGKER